jgi:hypothetical protein
MRGVEENPTESMSISEMINMPIEKAMDRFRGQTKGIGENVPEHVYEIAKFHLGSAVQGLVDHGVVGAELDRASDKLIGFSSTFFKSGIEGGKKPRIFNDVLNDLKMAGVLELKDSAAAEKVKHSLTEIYRTALEHRKLMLRLAGKKARA